MKDYIIHHEWKIIEEGLTPEFNRISESIFSIGNGRMGQRANFEEKYSGDSLRGAYIAGIYYPDKTKVGWWKNGYPEYYAKIINATNWIGINIKIEGQELDLAKVNVISFTRELDMQHGLLSRHFVAGLNSGKLVEVKSERFISIDDTELGAVKYSVKPLNFSGNIQITPYLDGDVYNEDANYNEKFWTGISSEIEGAEGYLEIETLKTQFRVCTGMFFRVFKNGEPEEKNISNTVAEKYIEAGLILAMNTGDEIVIEKTASTVTSLNYPKEVLRQKARDAINRAKTLGYEKLLQNHKTKWLGKWQNSDIKIEGDKAAQQGIRYCIFQLNQTYSGDDERLNIGPKGFTGEKYGGLTYWYTEAYCLPFYLNTAPMEVPRNLLLYRHKPLRNAIENAKKLGFENGAALYPMVTIDGKECHNEWEITFEEIHRNGAIAYAIRNYVNYTGDTGYLAPYGFEVLLAVSRFWSQRVNWSADKGKYVILGVTGPNEYENNINNNFHTNYLATWTLKYTLDVVNFVKKEFPILYEELVAKWKFNELQETGRWKDIIDNMYFPADTGKNVFLQQDGFLDKELAPAGTIPEDEKPINQHWSWDRILRSCFIKQADTLQSLFWFEDDFDKSTLKRHFDFYEPLTVHESSLSPCVHSIIAAKLGYFDRAYELYLRTSRLDLDDYNNDTEDGLHITSMGGTWMAFVMGFGGLRVKNGKLIFNPFLPENWDSYSFRVNFRSAHIEVIKKHSKLLLINHSEADVPVIVWGKELILEGGGKQTIKKHKNE